MRLDELDHDALQGLLTTATFGRPLYILPQTVSTNDEVKRLALQDAPEGVVVLAETQTGGRGRQGRRFASPPGVGIYLSILLRPSVDVGKLPQLTLMAGVAAAEAVAERTALPIRLKWPNDLEIQGKKIGGILTEALLRPGSSPAVILGIGINVNTPLDQFPLDLQPYVTSLALAAKRCRLPRLPLIASLLGHLESLYATFQTAGMSPIIERWLHFGPILGRRIRYEHDTTPRFGTVLGLDEDGALEVECENGTHERVIAGTVIFI